MCGCLCLCESVWFLLCLNMCSVFVCFVWGAFRLRSWLCDFRICCCVYDFVCGVCLWFVGVCVSACSVGLCVVYFEGVCVWFVGDSVHVC